MKDRQNEAKDESPRVDETRPKVFFKVGRIFQPKYHHISGHRNRTEKDKALNDKIFSQDKEAKTSCRWQRAKGESKDV